MKTTKLPNYGGISSHDSEFNGLKKGSLTKSFCDHQIVAANKSSDK